MASLLSNFSNSAGFSEDDNTDDENTMRRSHRSRHAGLDCEVLQGMTAAVCRICYAGEHEDEMGVFLRPTPCNCAGERSAVHEKCLQRWQTIARQNLQWAAGSTCHACNSPYLVNLAQAESRIPVAILGGTGLVGRALAARLVSHPLFSLGPVLGSSASTGRELADVWREKEAALESHYGEATWKAVELSPEGCLDGVIVESMEQLRDSKCRYVISCIAPSLGHIEDALQSAGFTIFSISPHARENPRNPLVVPEANGDELLHSIAAAAVSSSEKTTIPLIKSPNCVSCGLSVVLAAIDGAYGVSGVSVTTFQALSGRGDAKYDTNLVLGNVYPLTGTVERTDEYQRRELMRIFPNIVRCAVSAHRVPVQNGHFIDVKLQTARPVKSKEDLKRVLRQFAPLRGLGLPSMPRAPIVVVEEAGRPRPKQDSDYEGGMAVAVGNISTNDGFFDCCLSVVVNNKVRGAWGAALLNAELYELHVRPLVARATPKIGGTRLDAIERFARRKAETEGGQPHWEVLLKWARDPAKSNLERWGVGPWEEGD